MDILSRGTILEIANNFPEDIIVDFGGPSSENGKYVGWITRGVASNYRPLLRSLPIFDTPEQSKIAMLAIVEECIKLKIEILDDKTNPLFQFLTIEENNVVQEISNAANNGNQI